MPLLRLLTDEYSWLPLRQIVLNIVLVFLFDLFLTTHDNPEHELFELVRAEPAVFNFIQHQLLDGVWYWDLEAPEREWVSPRFWQTLGYAPDQVPPAPGAWRDPGAPPPTLPPPRPTWPPASPTPPGPSTRCCATCIATARRCGCAARACPCATLPAGPCAWWEPCATSLRRSARGAYAQEVANHYGSILSNQSVYIIKTDPAGKLHLRQRLLLRAVWLRQQGHRYLLTAEHHRGRPAQVHCRGDPLLPGA